MKKFLSLVFGLIMCLGCGIALAACGKVTLKSITIDSGLNRSVLVGEELDTSNVVATVKWSDGKTATITSADLEFGEIDTTTPGTRDLEITYTKEGYTFVVKIKVGATDAEVESIIRMESKLLTQYNANVGVSQTVQDGFYDDADKIAKRIYVGDDNAFNFRIAATGIDSEGEDIELASLQTTVTVKLVEGDTKTTLTGDALTQYVSVNPTNAVLDFTQAAVGKVFEVTVDAVKKGAYPVKPFTATLTVVDGFNVYDALDLSVYDNKYDYLSTDRKNDAERNHFGFKNLHTQVMAKYGMTAEEIAGIKAMILQNNISIRREDVPAANFYQTAPSWSVGKTDLPVVGSLINRDSEGVYYRFVKDGQFQFVGNYFKIDASEFPKVVLEGDANDPYINIEGNKAIKVQCSTLFYTTGIDKSETGLDENLYNTASATWKNISFIGNGALNNGVENSGSILLSKWHKLDATIENNIVNNFYIDYLVRSYNDEYYATRHKNIINKCKGYSSYQCLLYVAGADLVVEDSIFRGANGPAIIADYKVNKADDSKSIPAHVNFINSEITSNVTGQEGWFNTYKASPLVAGIKNFEGLFNGSVSPLPQSDKTIMSTAETINVVALMKADTADWQTAARIGGYIRFFDTRAQYEAQEALEEEFEIALGNAWLSIPTRLEAKITQMAADAATAAVQKKEITADQAEEYAGNYATQIKNNPGTMKQLQQLVVLEFTTELVATYKNKGLVYGLDMDKAFRWTSANEAIAKAVQYQMNTDEHGTKHEGDAGYVDLATAKAYMASNEDLQVFADFTKQGLSNIAANNGMIYIESDASAGFFGVSFGLDEQGNMTVDTDHFDISCDPTQKPILGAYFGDADSNYLNLYMFNGMGVILQMYDIA